MNTFDSIIILCLLINTLLSTWRGFVSEAVNFSAWILSIVAAWLFYPAAATLFLSGLDQAILANIIGFLIVFICVRILMYALRNLLNTIIEATPLSFVNRLLGSVLGIIKGIAIVVLLTALASFTDFPQSTEWHNALIVPFFEQLTLNVMPFLPDFWAEQITHAFPSQSIHLE